MQKRAQVTVFTILGIIVVALIMFAVFFYGESIKDFTSRGELDASQLEPVREFIVSCAEETVENDLELLRKNAGYFNKIDSVVVYSGNEINSLIDNGVNVMNSKTGIEREISSHVKNKLENSCSLDDFNLNIEKGVASVVIDIGDSNVVVEINYPLVISKGDVSLRMDEFSFIVESGFGKVYF